MTVVVGLESDTGVYIGADSQATAGGRGFETSFQKVFVNGDYLIGICGSPRMGQLLQYSLSVPPQYGEDDIQHMCTTFVNSVRLCFRDGGFTTFHGGAEMGGTFLVGYKGKLYTMYHDFQLARDARRYYAVGSGDVYAYGSFSTTEGRDERERLSFALQAAAEHNTGVSGPFLIGFQPNGESE